ncbi:Piwi domain-domain-containing protein [Lobosporangium transversale]|uniref:Piwi domain-domain-containing protein n=1 Tax=Lobosporangium transversale TaxID=64571 RepID=A0A1Y2GB28_9FUNG|nr:Piwi domain-domain-containing protein [Lobosporangium transversale]ORZ05957.1 Piwi domain-domain-containing protein [Lobosporangium transversale]|eukprot:XP_021877338.1 Piwi domain-domain-containing protein [Lobosporangium transversale]
MSTASSGPALTPNALRPDGGGRAGRHIQVRTNFFAIKKLKADVIWQYDVSISPDVPAEKAKQVWKVIETTIPELGGNKMVFDGKAQAYSAMDLGIDKVRHKVELFDSGRPAAAAPPAAAAAKKKNEFTVSIAFVTKIDVSELHAFLNKTGPITPNCMVAIQALNIAMSHKLFSEMVSAGRSAYRPQGAQNLGGGVEKWDGVFQSVRPGQGKLYANIDIASTAFMKGGRMDDLMVDILRARDQNDLKRLQRHDIIALQRHFKGASFTVTHRGADFKKRYKISEISASPADKITFDQETNDGKKKKVSIPEYYQTAYNLRLKYPFLPCIGVKAREGQTMYFPVEVCNIVPGKRYTKKLNEEQTTAMIKSTCLRPQARMEKIYDSLRVLDFDRNEYLQRFGMEISREMAVVPARILAPPRIVYRDRVEVTPQFGGWQMNPQRKMVQGSELRSWGSNNLFFSRLREDAVRRFVRELVTTLNENGMNVSQPNPPIRHAQMGSVNKTVDSFLDEVKQKCGSPVNLLLVVMPNKCQTYSALKTYCETTHSNGVMTQCALSKNVSRVNKQYCGNLGLKINAKLGGVNSCLPSNSVPFLTQVPTMILGADVTHPAPGENKPSVVAVVGSMDHNAFRYAGRLKVQESRVEVIEGLKFLVYHLLVAFKDRNRVYPQRILFYRDGVSEGQYEQVMRTEVQAVREACDHINQTQKPPTPYNPKVTFCVVKKRHHARLFPMNPNDADKSGNCIAGTVVDSVITHPTEFDFYLQSHGGLQGTSRPTLYHVLLDENKFTSDSLQELTFKLCHVYARCTKSVSIVPSVYYAHLLAFRARHYQGGDFSDAASTSSGSSAQGPTFETSVLH